MSNLADDADRAIRMVRESKNLVYDTETSGLDWKRNHPVGYVIGAPTGDAISPEDVVYIPIRHGGGGNLLGGKPLTSETEGFVLHEFEEAVASAFAYRRQQPGIGRVVGHHTKFDVHMSANAGILLGRNLACTQNMAALLDEYAGRYSLADSAERMGVTPKKGQVMYDEIARNLGLSSSDKGIMGHFWKLPGTNPVVMDYSCGDGVTTWELYVKQMAKLEDEQMGYVRDLENDLIWTIFRMERKGIRVDLTAIDELREATENKIREALSHFPPGFNVRSPLQVKKAFQDAGYSDWPRTEKGNASFTESWLKKNELGRQIIQIRQMSNLLNSFVNPMADRHMFNGRVHATLNQLKSDDKGTISGRFSCSDPNLQQVPKRIKEIAKPFRKLFVADPGKIFWERDYSQCEPRLFAHYSQDPNLLGGYLAEPFVDAHATVAKLLNVERDPTAKRMNMGILTGMQPKSFAGHMGWPLDEATRKWNMWFEAFPGVKKFQNNAKSRLGERGFVYTVLKRRCRLESSRFAYHGTSKIIQGSNADIVKKKLLDADRMCEDAGDIVEILMTVHDSYNGQREDTPQAKALLTEMVHMLEQVQCEPFNLTVPFVMEGTEGPNWSVATFGE